MTTGTDTKIDLPELTTERLWLRKLALADAEDVFAYASDPEVARFVTWEAHGSIRDSIAFLNMVKQKYDNGQIAEWGIADKSTGRIIGTCGFTWVRPEHGKGEIGYALAQTHWRKGLMTEAVEAVFQFGLHTLHLNRIEARCKVENTGSERVMQKCGMRYEGTFRQTMLVKGKYIDLKMYAILRDEWEQRKTKL
jgi:[ribosomal protein S5]-alanine N-acetyltransferase